MNKQQRIISNLLLSMGAKVDGENLLVHGNLDTVTAALAAILRDGDRFFTGSPTGILDRNGTEVCEGDTVKVYYQGMYHTCTIVYDPRHAAFFIRWPDGYVNQYFLNGSSYEVIDK